MKSKNMQKHFQAVHRTSVCETASVKLHYPDVLIFKTMSQKHVFA